MMSNKPKKEIGLFRVLLVEFLILGVVFLALFWAENRVAERAMKKKLYYKTESIADAFAKNYTGVNIFYDVFDKLMDAKAESLAYLLNHTDRYNAENIQSLCDVFASETIYLVNSEEEIPDDLNNAYYLTHETDSGMIAAVEYDSEADNLLGEALEVGSDLFSSVNEDDFYFIVSNQKGYIVLWPDEEFYNNLHKINEIGIELSDLDYEHCKWLTIQGKKYYTYASQVPGFDMTAVCGIEYEEMAGYSHVFAALLCGLIAVVFTVLVTYSFFARQHGRLMENDRESSKHHHLAIQKVFVSMLTGLLVITAGTYYIQSLYSLSSHSVDTAEEKKTIMNNIELGKSGSQTLEEVYNRQYLTVARIIGRILSDAPELRTEEHLHELSDMFGIEYIMIFDSKGREILSDSSIFGFEISDDPESQSYAFNVLKHGVPYVVQEAREEDLTGAYHQFIGVTLSDRDGNYDGFLQICISPEFMKDALKEISFDNILYNAVSKSENDVLAINRQDSQITFYSRNGNLKGQQAQDMGIKDDQLRSNYLGYINLADDRLFADSMEADGHYIYLVVSRDVLFTGRINMTVFTGIVSLISMLAFVVYFNSREVARPLADSPDSPYVDVTTADGTSKRTLNIMSRIIRNQTLWRDKPYDEKSKAIIRFVILLVGILITVSLLLRGVVYSDNSIFGFITSSRWNKGFNVFALTKSLMFIANVYLAVVLADYILNIFIRLSSPKNETIIRLLKSLIKYISILSTLYYTLSQFGFDSQSLLASAGLLTLVVGLGAKDLVTDILAGIFIIFENEFQVGDIIEVNGYKGRVMEIGIRTTRIINTVQDVKSINNRNLTNIVNKTKRNSFCDVIINVPFDQNIEAIEAMLKEELPKIKDICPYILDGPTYGGVDDMSGRSMRLSIRSECLETHKFEVRTVINREVKAMFERNGFKLM